MLVPLLVVVSANIVAPHAEIDTKLASSLASGKPQDIFLCFSGIDSVISAHQSSKFADRGDSNSALVASLKKYAQENQQGAAMGLSLLQIYYEIFWLNNEMFVPGADEALVNSLATITNVTKIKKNPEIHLISPIVTEMGETGDDSKVAWGVGQIEADKVWDTTGHKGEGIIVGNIDTGVSSFHETLKDSYLTTAPGWKDCVTKTSDVPVSLKAFDDNGHGTHTMGTIVGSMGIGVCPAAKWVACKALNAAGSGFKSNLLCCGQFMMCLNGGDEKPCSIFPHVVSNSWGGNPKDGFFNDTIKAWRKADIIPVFANGNSGPACYTTNSPADSPEGVISVAASNKTNMIASFSSRGPSNYTNDGKPDIAAPGVNITSAYIPLANSYKALSGTSMACPHVAGTVCLMLSKNKNLKYDQVKNALTSTASKTKPAGESCANVSDNVFPNFQAGYGIVNAYDAVGKV